jgi:hypothetical protein
MVDQLEDSSYFFSKRTDKTYVSKGFANQFGTKLRIVSKVIDGDQGLKFGTAGREVILRTTPAGRYEIKATVVEDERAIKTLVIQRYSCVSGPLERQYFALVGDEIDVLLNFIASIKAVPLKGSTKIHLTDEMLRDIVLNHGQARRIFARHEELFREIAQSEDLTRDLVAVGYRRKQLEHFESLLTDPKFLAAERTRLHTTPEGVWQQFFEENTWIFGYSLSYHFLSRLADQKLEQVVRGRDLIGAGKRTDALMKTRGIISSLCFIEIKRHDTPLLSAQPYRAGAWAPSAELSGGVSQVQATVQDAVENIGRRLMPSDEIGDPTGEVLFNVEPRSCLVGNLGQFGTQNGINEPKFRSFELYRRNTFRPEIITFDELLQRARFIVDHGEHGLASDAKIPMSKLAHP